MFELPDATIIVAAALAEDLSVAPEVFMPGAPPDYALLGRDVTTASVLDEDAAFAGTVTAREACVVCGLPVVAAVYERLSASAGLFEPVEVFPLVAEGSRVVAGTPVAEVSGLASAVLAGERSALDFMMLLSGMATETARWVDAAAGQLAVCDTRKTLPGMRALSKYAVAVGGGVNHRENLNDMVLVKDNHLRRVGVTDAVRLARAAHPALQVEVEADTLEQAVEAVTAGADMILLDNMGADELRAAVQACRRAENGRRVLLEVSGGIELARMPELVSSGVDRVSSSALTLAPPVDFALDEA